MTLSISLGEDPTVKPGALDYNIQLNGEVIHEGAGSNTRYYINITDIKDIKAKTDATLLFNNLMATPNIK